jgi:NitT/TauT family transport system substrate-binding protein
MLKRSQAIAVLGAATVVPAGAQERPLRVGASLSGDSGMLAYYAQEGGFFSKAGLNVEITSFANTGGIVQAVAGNALDIGWADMIQLGNAALHGVPVGCFAGAGMYSSDAPTTVLCVAKNGAVHSAKDLENQTIAVIALGTQSSAATTEWLRANGADVGRIKLYELPFPQMAAGLEHGTVQAVMMGEPFVSFARNDIRVLGKPFDAVAKSFYIGVWFAPRDWAGRNAAVLRRYTDAIYEAGRWANAHHDETLQMLARLTKVDIERMRTMTRVSWATSLEPRLMQPPFDIGFKYKLIDRPVVATDLMLRV